MRNTLADLRMVLLTFELKAAIGMEICVLFSLQTETYCKCDVTVIVVSHPDVTHCHSNVNPPRSMTLFYGRPSVHF